MAAVGCNKGCQIEQLPNQRAKDTWQLLAVTKGAGNTAAKKEGQRYMAAAGHNKGCQVKQLPNQRGKDTWQLLAVTTGAR